MPNKNDIVAIRTFVDRATQVFVITIDNFMDFFISIRAMLINDEFIRRIESIPMIFENLSNSARNFFRVIIFI